MGDEMDGCECVWTHEFAMQRLLAFIRQNQNHCTDTDCIDVTDRLQQLQTAPNGNSGDENTNFMLMSVFMIVAMIMYIISPDSILRMTNTKRRRTLTQNNNSNDGGSPPPPPPPPAPPAVN